MNMLHSTAELSRATWRETPRGLVLIPLGALEQHGPHLPLATDTLIAVAVAQHLCMHAIAHGSAASVAPAVAYGASGEHEGFDGTLSIGTSALASVITELGRSASLWATQIVFINGHGGNVDALRTSVPTLRSEGTNASWISCEPGGNVTPPDPHAGQYETSLISHLDHTAVRMELAEPGSTEPLHRILPRLRDEGIAGVATNGVLGDPTGASATLGAQLFSSVCDRAVECLAADRVGTDGRRIGKPDSAP